MKKLLLILVSVLLMGTEKNISTGYVSAPLEYIEYEKETYIIQNLEVVEFKSGLKLEQCLTSTLNPKNIILICTATNLKNVYIPLKDSLIFDGKIFPQNSYIIAIDIDYEKIIKDIGGRK